VKVIVIGAGAAGLSIGWRLRQAGAEVVVIERGQPGRGATWAAAGMIAAAPENSPPGDVEGQLAWHSARLWPGFAAEIEAASGRSVSFLMNGGLAIARTPEELAALRLRGMRGEGQLISSEAAREREPRLAPDVLGALWIEQEAKVDNRALGPALATGFVRAEGALLVNETVVRFEVRGNRIVGVRTPFAVHQADAYVLAAGAWTSRIEGLPPDALPPIIPVKGEMLALEPPAGETVPDPAIFAADTYLVGQGERLFVGATVTREGFDTSPTDKAADWLLDSAASLAPSLRNWAVVEHWAGLRPGTPDDLPILGQGSLDGLFVAGGQFRSGILYTPAIAEALCALVLGESPPFDLAAFNPNRFDGSNQQ
jgi:glycine oxidase